MTGLMSRSEVDIDERIRGRKIGGGLEEITINGATKGFPRSFLQARSGIRALSRIKSLSFSTADAA